MAAEIGIKRKNKHRIAIDWQKRINYTIIGKNAGENFIFIQPIFVVYCTQRNLAHTASDERIPSPMDSSLYACPRKTSADLLELLCEEVHSIADMKLTYRMYRVAIEQYDGYAIEAALNCDDCTPLFLFDQSEARANAFFAYLVNAEVFPCTLRDVLEDTCGHFSPVRSEKSRDFSLQIPENML